MLKLTRLTKTASRGFSTMLRISAERAKQIGERQYVDVTNTYTCIQIVKCVYELQCLPACYLIFGSIYSGKIIASEDISGSVLDGEYVNTRGSKLTLKTDAQNHTLSGYYEDGTSDGKYGGQVAGQYIQKRKDDHHDVERIFVMFNVNWEQKDDKTNSVGNQYLQTMTGWTGVFDTNTQKITSLFTYLGEDEFKSTWDDFVVNSDEFTKAH